MTHEQFVTFIRSILGKTPHMEARESLGDLIRNRKFEFRIHDRWVPKGTYGRNPDNPLKKVDGKELDYGSVFDGGITIFVHEDART